MHEWRTTTIAGESALQKEIGKGQKKTNDETKRTERKQAGGKDERKEKRGIQRDVIFDITGEI